MWTGKLFRGWSFLVVSFDIGKCFTNKLTERVYEIRRLLSTSLVFHFTLLKQDNVSRRGSPCYWFFLLASHPLILSLCFSKRSTILCGARRDWSPERVSLVRFELNLLSLFLSPVYALVILEVPSHLLTTPLRLVHVAVHDQILKSSRIVYGVHTDCTSSK